MDNSNFFYLGNIISRLCEKKNEIDNSSTFQNNGSSFFLFFDFNSFTGKYFNIIFVPLHTWFRCTQYSDTKLDLERIWNALISYIIQCYIAYHIKSKIRFNDRFYNYLLYHFPEPLYHSMYAQSMELFEPLGHQ